MRPIYLVLPLIAGSFLLSVGVADVQSTIATLNFDANSSSPTVSIESDSPNYLKAEAIAFEESTYSFTMTLPDYTGEKFSKVSLTEQTEGPNHRVLSFDPSKTTAFLGTPTRRGSAVAVTSSWIDETGTIWVEFNPSLAPRTTLTLEFKGEATSAREPHEYGVAAYPDAQRSVAVFVGTGTLNSVESAY